MELSTSRVSRLRSKGFHLLIVRKSEKMQQRQAAELSIDSNKEIEHVTCVDTTGDEENSSI
jgi:hypothetical protein